MLHVTACMLMLSGTNPKSRNSIVMHETGQKSIDSNANTVSHTVVCFIIQ